MTDREKSPRPSKPSLYPDPSIIVANTALDLLEYCRANNWEGYDPYDALNSRIFRALSFLNFKAARLVLTQGIKRFPFNLRPLLMIPKTPNPKGIALFISALIKLKKSELVSDDKAISSLLEKLLAQRSPEKVYSCWGYNFDWQTRIDLVPEGSPNIICTTFGANALLDIYEISPDPTWLHTAVSSADFILDKLFWRESTSRACFSYTPMGRTEIHNANLLGAAFLARMSKVAGQRRFLEPALEATRYSVSKQHEDGSWDYGESSHQRWVDNFHTGFNLVALNRMKEFGETAEFDEAIRRGFNFYVAHFIREDGAPKYFHNSVYPIDIHSISQSIITLVELGEFAEDANRLVHSVFNWAMDHMRDKRGFFYYQKHRHYTVRTPYMRWSQAWMLLALSTLLENK